MGSQSPPWQATLRLVSTAHLAMALYPSPITLLPLFVCLLRHCLLQVSLLGFSPVGDEWLPRYSPRLALLNWRSRGVRGALSSPSGPIEWEQERDPPPYETPDVDSVRRKPLPTPPLANLCTTTHTITHHLPLLCPLIQAAVFRPHTFGLYHKGHVFIDLFNAMWLKRNPSGNCAYQLLLNRLRLEVNTKPCKLSFAWVSDTVAMFGKNADIMTVCKMSIQYWLPRYHAPPNPNPNPPSF